MIGRRVESQQKWFVGSEVTQCWNKSLVGGLNGPNPHGRIATKPMKSMRVGIDGKCRNRFFRCVLHSARWGLGMPKSILVLGRAALPATQLPAWCEKMGVLQLEEMKRNAHCVSKTGLQIDGGSAAIW